MLRKGPIARFGANRLGKGCLRREVRDLVHDVLTLGLQNDLAQIKLTVNKARVVGKIEALSQLDDDVINGFDVRSRHIDCQIEVLTLNVAEDVASIVVFNH